jgi:hypothetical protein
VARRFVAVRQRLPKEESPQLDLLETTQYDYFCYVTTEALTPWQTHKKYGERATCETWIEEAKGQMSMGKIRTASFWRTRLYSTARCWLTTLCVGWPS